MGSRARGNTTPTSTSKSGAWCEGTGGFLCTLGLKLPSDPIPGQKQLQDQAWLVLEAPTKPLCNKPGLCASVPRFLLPTPAVPGLPPLIGCVLPTWELLWLSPAVVWGGPAATKDISPCISHCCSPHLSSFGSYPSRSQAGIAAAISNHVWLALSIPACSEPDTELRISVAHPRSSSSIAPACAAQMVLAERCSCDFSVAFSPCSCRWL